jgi:hypothetical protein
MLASALLACDSLFYLAMGAIGLFPELGRGLESAFFPSMFRALRPAPPLADSEPSCDFDELPALQDESGKTLARRLLHHWSLMHGILRLPSVFLSNHSAVNMCMTSLALEVSMLSTELLCTDALILRRALSLVLKSMALLFVCLLARMGPA